MVTKIRGHIQGGVVVPDTPLDMPDGLQVDVQITVSDTADPVESNYGPAVDSVFGMWKDREDIPDSSTWVRKQRDAWQNRLSRDPD